jgi:hypothetical protein
MPTKSYRAIGSLDCPDAERRKLAKNSRSWRCETCGPIKDLLKHPEDSTCNTNECGSASSSRVAGHPHCGEQSDIKSLSSDSDGENRDSSTDSHGSSTSTNGSDSDGGSSTSGESQTGRPKSALNGIEDGEQQPDENQSVSSQQIDHRDSPETPVANATEQNLSHQDRRRSYPPLVFISISVLLFLLILRRVVMIVQA